MHFGLLLLFILVCALVPAFRKFLIAVTSLVVFIAFMGYIGGPDNAGFVWALFFAVLIFIPFVGLAVKWIATNDKRKADAAELAQTVAAHRSKYGAFKSKAR